MRLKVTKYKPLHKYVRCPRCGASMWRKVGRPPTKSWGICIGCRFDCYSMGLGEEWRLGKRVS